MKRPSALRSLALLGWCVLCADAPAASPFPSADLQTIVDSFQSSGASVLHLPKGTYRLPAQGILLDGLRNVEIDAQGSLLIATSVQKPALTITHCDRLTLRNFTIDCDPLPFTQGSITAIDAKAHRFEFKLHDGYPPLTADYRVPRFYLFEKDRPRWKPGAPDYYVASTEKIAARTGRITFGSDTRGFGLLRPGDRIALTRRAAPAILIGGGSKGLLVEDCTLHSFSFGVMVRFAEESGTFRRLRIVPGPPPPGATQPRLISTCADAFNAAYTRKGPVLEECEFAFMGDDSLNVHGPIFPVLKRFADGAFLTMRPQKDDEFTRVVRPGDEADFLAAPNYRIAASAKIARFEAVRVAGAAGADLEKWRARAREIWPTFPLKNDASFFRVSLEPGSPVPAEADFFELPACGAPGYVVRNCRFHDHRARGLRLMSGNGLVENNRFERIKGAAISIGPSFAFWREAGWCRNVTVKNNTFRDIGEGANLTWPDSYTVGAISVFAGVDPTGSTPNYWPGNDRLVIEGNTIDGCSVAGIQVCAARDVKVAGNILRNVNQAHPPDAGSQYGLNSREPIVVKQAPGLVLENNRVQ